MKKIIKRISIGLGLIVILSLLGMFVYTSIYYHANESVNQYAKTTNTVTYSDTNDMYTFKNKEKPVSSLIIYQGAKVETKAYLQLASKISQNKIDVYLVKAPFNLAVFKSKVALDIINDNPDVSSWYLSGHSLGGAMIATVALDNPKIKGIIFLGAYPNNDLSKSNLRTLFIKGSNDLVLSKDNYTKGLSLVPSGYEEYLIKNGNHAGFAEYGKQKGDGLYQLKDNEQINLTSAKISEFIKK